ncbi:MAG: hypothetical protein U0Q03_17995 [Acidimicrobiales bacterium]
MGEQFDDVSVVRRVPARVGLVGNPSDGYGGAVLATPVPMLAADVTVRPHAGLRLDGAGETNEWPTLGAWRASVTAEGCTGEQRLITAALAEVLEHLDRRDGRDARDGVSLPGLAVSWTTDVPRSVGLAGSSALAVAVIDAVAAAHGTSLDRRVLAALALRAERMRLGITAGWQDRVVQSVGATVLVDAAALDRVDGHEVPAVETPQAGSAVRLVVGWRAADSTSSDDYHAPLRRHADELAGPMAELAALARGAARAWSAGDRDAVADAVDSGWRVRQACAPLRADHAALVEAARAAGSAATTPGSGGSVVALPADDAATARVLDALAAVGATACTFDAV